MKNTGIFWFTVIFIRPEIQIIESESHDSSFNCWDYLSVGGQRARKVSLCPEVKPNMW
jgi:hypothetical protein